LDSYYKIAQQYKKLSLKHERKLIKSAKKGDLSAQEELLLHLLGFFLYRINSSPYFYLIKKSREDIMQDCLILALKNIQTYNLRYRNDKGEFLSVHLSTYMWKGITGLIINSIKSQKEICFSDLQDYQIKQY
jgi:DNA-directed RNA polymerase specialized sigma24 family protein